jgi:hypothetical protein
MFYKVKNEKCGNGLKPRYTVGQVINEIEIHCIKSDFQKYYYSMYDDMKELKIEYHNVGLFGNKIFIYSIDLEKINSKK